MSYINLDAIKSFYPDETWVTDLQSLMEFDGVIKQIDDIIFQHTGITTPETSDTAVPYLVNIACRLFVWFTSGKQGTLSDKEYERRRQLYQDAMNELIKISNGEIVLTKDNASISQIPATVFKSTRRIELL